MQDNLWIILFCSWFASEIVLVLVTRRKTRSGRVQDRGSIYVLWIVFTASIWCGIWFARTHSIGPIAGGRWALPISIVLLIAGLAIRWTAILSLGRAFSVNVTIDRDHRLHRSGLFAMVQHPSYTGITIIFLSLGIRLENFIALTTVIVPPLLALHYRMRVEESALARAFGAEYEDYRSTTKRLFPGIY